MVGIQGIAGVPEQNKPERSSGARDNSRTTEAGTGSESSSDGVAISGEAQAAAQVADTLRVAASQSDIRADRVAAAKEAIARGDYKKPEIVESVAQKIDKYL